MVRQGPDQIVSSNRVVEVLLEARQVEGDVDQLDEDGEREAEEDVTHQTPALPPTLVMGQRGHKGPPGKLAGVDLHLAKLLLLRVAHRTFLVQFQVVNCLLLVEILITSVSMYQVEQKQVEFTHFHKLGLQTILSTKP